MPRVTHYSRRDRLYRRPTRPARMAALRAAALAQDTIVIPTSDHGEMLGERGLWYKMSFLEGARRVCP